MYANTAGRGRKRERLLLYGGILKTEREGQDKHPAERSRHMKDQERWAGDGRQQIGADRRGEPEGRTGGRITF